MDPRWRNINAEHCWLSIFNDFLSPEDIVRVDTLRQWSLSQVVRIKLSHGHDIVAKRALPTYGPTEVETYRDCLIPSEILHPTILATHQELSWYGFLMEDLAGVDLERRPSASGFLEAARRLAQIRYNGRRITASVPVKHLLTVDELLLDLHYVVSHLGAEYQEEANVIGQNVGTVQRQAMRLWQELPPTVNHNDYHCKNLIDVGGKIIAVDWASARVSPHNGDLFCLIEEAGDRGITPAAIVDAYNEALREVGGHVDSHAWHIDMGGLCWSICCLRWILEFGSEAIPVSRDWIPSFLSDIQRLVEHVR